MTVRFQINKLWIDYDITLSCFDIYHPQANPGYRSLCKRLAHRFSELRPVELEQEIKIKLWGMSPPQDIRRFSIKVMETDIRRMP